MINFSEITEQKISEKFEGLSQDLKNVLSSVNTSTTIENIAAKFRLDEEKITMLIQLVGLVILGFTSFENMKEEMKETIDISPQFIPLIADEIRQKIFSPVMNSLQKIITEKRPPTPAPTAIPPMPQPVTPTPRPVDEYREPTAGPEVVDLRKAPPISAPAPTPKPIIPTSPAPKPLTSPLTFTRPIQPLEPPKPAPITPLIEAEPHLPAKISPEISAGKIPPSAPPAPEPRPQYIMRPSGAPPTDHPENVLDLRKDKGEF